ncbi:MAG: AAA family ATPase [Fimbriimonadales bacterium]|nr:AAA family ATPase [Fimbriimonadales bacterium]
MRRESRTFSVRELETPLAEWLAQTMQGRGGVLLITGEPGTGRTSALRWIVERAQTQGFTVADSWCRGDATEPSHLPLTALLETLCFELGEASKPLQEPLERWLQNPQAWHLPTRLIYPLREVARQRPLLLALDDLHRAHENLQRTLLNWLIALRLEPIGLVLTAALPLRGALADLRRTVLEREAGEVWTLRPFTLPEVDALLQERLPAHLHTESLRRALYELTGGNPLYLSEILDGIAEGGDGSLAAVSAPIPPTLREALLRRLESFGASEWAVARALSLFESVVPRAALPLIAQQNERVVAKGVAALQALGWLEESGVDMLRWRNRLFREVVYSATELRLREQGHERAAEVLQQIGAPELMVLEHLRRCTPTQARLQRLYEAYLRLRTQLSPRQRLELLDACLEWASKLGDTSKRVQLLCDRPYLLFQQPEGLLHALDASQQALAALEAHPEVDPQGELRVQVVCARAGQLTQLGRAREAQESLQELLAHPELGDAQRLMAELSLAYVYACQGDLRRAYAIHRAVWTRLRENQAWLNRWSGVLHYTLRYALACGDKALACETLERIEPWTAQPECPPRIQTLYQLMYAEMAAFCGRGAELQARARAIVELAEHSGEQLAALEPWFLTLLYRQAQEAVRVAERALRLAQHALGQEREAEWRYRKAQAHLEAGDYAEAVATADEARRAALKIGNQGLVAKAWLLRAQARLLQHQPRDAADALQQAVPLVRSLNLPELDCELALLHALTEPEAAAHHAERAVAVADSWGHALYRGLAYAVRGHILNRPEDIEQSEILLSEYGAPQLLRAIAPRETPMALTEGWDIFVQLLGDSSVRFRRAVMTRKHWASPRARALFAHLVLHGGTPIDAHTLLEQHFPHLDLDKARVNLQTVISAARRSLRKAFGDAAGEWIHYENGLYRWAPPHTWRVDVHEFESVAHDALSIADPEEQLARLDAAIQRYTGDLLPEFADESWCALAHQRARALLLECLLARAQRRMVKGRLGDAAADCERILEADPADENALRLLLQIYQQLGRPRDALRFFQQAQRYARETLDSDLSPATRQAFEKLLASVG